MKKAFSIMLAIIICVMTIPLGVCADENDAFENNVFIQNYSQSLSNSNYDTYLESYKGVQNAVEDIVILADDFKAENEGVVLSSSTAKFTNENGVLKAYFETSETAMYNIVLYYRHFGETSNKIKLSLSLDEQIPFNDCEELSLNRFWKDKSSKPQIDNKGNEFASEQIAVDEFRTQSLSDGTGVSLEPFKYYISAGTHIITISAQEGIFELEKIVLKAPDNIEPYSNIKKSYEENGYKWSDTSPLIFQGEDAVLKNSKAIIDQVDKSSAEVFPNSPYENLVNNIGGDNWATTGESVIWEIKVEKSGIYKLAFKYQQRGVINGVTYRKLLIDGKVPFVEASAIDFPYTTGWDIKEFTDKSGEVYGIYLEEGIHEIELCCTLGPISELYSRLESIVSNIGDRYLKIIMITGETPDDNRDYELFKLIPEFNESLTKDKNALLKLANDFDKLNSGNTNQISASFRNMARVLNNMIEDKYAAHQYVSDYYTNYNTISAWLSDMRSMPLRIDQMEFCSEKHECDSAEIGFFGKLWFSIQRFIVSFTKDYANSSEKTYDLRIWVNWGRDQAQILNSLIDNQFTPKSGINVNLEIVSMSVINGIISGNAPDLILHAPRSTPVNLAMRGALVDLSDFDDFDEVLKKFQPGAEIPYQYKDGCYAIPDTQSFMVMYYRKDVLDELNLPVPTTWEEFIDVSTKILRNNMQVYLPYTRMNGTTVADAGVGSLSLFPSLLIQNNVDIYNSARNRCNLDSFESISVFDEWTELYTDYRILKEANFYNRFRLGTMPLGISSYTLYTQIMTAAPEISGKWGISLIPGTVKKDGVVDHSISGAGTGACILNVSNHKKEAWEFLKWWTSSETQFSYSENLECVLGPIGRQTVSNIQAFKNLSWNKTDKAILLEQWENVVEIPEVPGSYYLSRGIDQAYWEVMNDKSTSKESLIKWSQIINAEITRKIKEYS